MLTNENLPEHLRGLLSLGEEQSLRTDQEGWRDYVAEFSLLAGDIPALLEALEWWFQWHREDDYPDAPDFFAPIHAWRALGQLRALEAVEPMLAHADMLDDLMDDWSSEDWPKVFGLIGPPAIEALVGFLNDPLHQEFPRAMAAGGLREIAKFHPDKRAGVVQVLADQMAKQEPLPTFNGLLLHKLLDLKAVEAAEVIERAFAAEVVDEQVCGCWMEVRDELGVEGLSIAPLKPRTWSPLQLDFPGRLTRAIDIDLAAESKRRQQAKREKAKRKSAQQARKRNRKTR